METYGNLGVLVVRCFGFGMRLRRMANLKAMEFCVGKKKDTVLCWKQDFWQDGLHFRLKTELRLKQHETSGIHTFKHNCQTDLSNPEKQQKNQPEFLSF